MTAHDSSITDPNKFTFPNKVIADRAQLAPLKVSNGDFARGRMRFLPNELFKLSIPAHDRPDVPFSAAPFMQDGQLMRVVGLYGKQRDPYRCWPLGVEPAHHQYLIDNGMKRGWFIKDEWMVKMDLEEQDRVFHTTCIKLGIAADNTVVIPPLPAAAPVDPLAALSPAERKLVAQARAQAAGPVGGSSVGGFMADLQLLNQCGGDPANDRLSLDDTARVSTYLHQGKALFMASADRWEIRDGFYHHKGALTWVFPVRSGEFDKDAAWPAQEFHEQAPIKLSILGLCAVYPEQAKAYLPEWSL